jgi:hypothetical protein
MTGCRESPDAGHYGRYELVSVDDQVPPVVVWEEDDGSSATVLSGFLVLADDGTFRIAMTEVEEDPERGAQPEAEYHVTGTFSLDGTDLLFTTENLVGQEVSFPGEIEGREVTVTSGERTLRFSRDGTATPGR